jgi:hypothetical protein
MRLKLLSGTASLRSAVKEARQERASFKAASLRSAAKKLGKKDYSVRMICPATVPPTGLNFLYS